MIAPSGIRNRTTGRRSLGLERLDLLVGQLAAVAVVPWRALGAGRLAARLELLRRAVAVVGLARSTQRAATHRRRCPAARTAGTARIAADLDGPSSQSRPSQRSASSRRRGLLRCCARSVSSMRNTNVPPWWRAKAQLNSAVRTLPTCRAGRRRGSRTRTFEARPVERGLLAHLDATLFVRVPMPSIDDLDLVADLHGADALGGAGEDHVAGQQGHHLET